MDKKFNKVIKYGGTWETGVFLLTAAIPKNAAIISVENGTKPNDFLIGDLIKIEVNDLQFICEYITPTSLRVISAPEYNNSIPRTAELKVYQHLSSNSPEDIVCRAEIHRLSNKITENENSFDSSTDWFTKFNRTYVDEHSRILDIFKTKPENPAIGDAYFDNENNQTMLYGKFTQRIQIIGEYPGGANTIAIIGDTNEFIANLATADTFYIGDDTYSSLSMPNVNVNNFLIANNIPLKYANKVLIIGIQPLTKPCNSNDICYLRGWEPATTSIKPTLDMYTSAEWQTLS